MRGGGGSHYRSGCRTEAVQEENRSDTRGTHPPLFLGTRLSPTDFQFPAFVYRVRAELEFEPGARAALLVSYCSVNSCSKYVAKRICLQSC